jgi:hypothetical protein
MKHFYAYLYVYNNWLLMMDEQNSDNLHLNKYIHAVSKWICSRKKIFFSQMNSNSIIITAWYQWRNFDLEHCT